MAVSKPESSVRYANRMGSHTSGRVALIVDDEPFARLSALQVLANQGYLVLEAADAVEALDLLDRNDDVSMVVTDINMPGSMNGLEMAQHIRNRDASIALVVTSGFEHPPESELAAAAHFLPKPYTPCALLNCVRAVERTMDRRGPANGRQPSVVDAQ